MVRSALSGSRIRDRRVAAGIRQSDLARAAGVSASYLNLIEHNRRRIGGKLLNDLARVLGCEPEALTEAGEAALLSSLREAAANGGASLPEVGGPEEFAGRYPGWAAVLAERHARVERLEREVRNLSDRLAHDPHLSATLHELLTAATAIRSTASILAGPEEIDSSWTARFLANLDADGRRLAEGAEALVRYLDGPDATEPGGDTPQEEVEAFFAASGWHLAALEAPDATDETVARLVAEAPQLRTSAGRSLARRAAGTCLGDARLLPLPDVENLRERPADEVVQRFGVSPEVALRRLALLPGAEAGLVVADGAGAIIFRKPLAGFPMPRHGAACPLWPVFLALQRPGFPIASVIEATGPGVRPVAAESIAVPIAPPAFGQTPVLAATMLLRPVPSPVQDPADRVGPACRICARLDCIARREPSVLARGAASWS